MYLAVVFTVLPSHFITHNFNRSVFVSPTPKKSVIRNQIYRLFMLLWGNKVKVTRVVCFCEERCISLYTLGKSNNNFIIEVSIYKLYDNIYYYKWLLMDEKANRYFVSNWIHTMKFLYVIWLYKHFFVKKNVFNF